MTRREAERAWVIDRTDNVDGERFFFERGPDYEITFDRLGVYVNDADFERTTLYPWHTVLAVVPL